MKPSVCRKGAWIELTVPVTSVGICSKQNARFYFFAADCIRNEDEDGISGIV